MPSNLYTVEELLTKIPSIEFSSELVKVQL